MNPTDRSRHSQRQLAAALCIAGAALLASGCQRESAEAASDGADAGAILIGPENIAVIAVGELESGPAISGTLTADRQAQVRAQIGGSVLQTYADEGQRVTSGQLLARIDAMGLEDAFLSARAAVTSATNNADIAARELSRSERLLAAGAIAERDIEQVRRNAITAAAALADARARLTSAQRQLGNTRIIAPLSGVVAAREASAGDVVQPGSALFTIVDPSSMRLEASVPADQLAAVRIGVPVTFTVSGYPGREIIGRVSRINPVADPSTRQVRIFVSMPNTTGALVGGLFATGRLASESQSGLVAPLSAIDVRSSEPAVLRVRQGKVERVNVLLGIRDERAERIQILSGVQAGDTVLLGAAQAITPGASVRVSAPADRPVTEPRS